MKKFLTVLFVILSICILVGCNNSNQTLGNTTDEILNYINSADFLNIIGKNNLKIVDTKFIGNSKIVGISSDNGCGYIVYEKNEDGNYIITSNRAIELSSKGPSATNFLINYESKFDNTTEGLLIISKGDKASRVEISINNIIYDKQLNIGNPSMIFLSDIALDSGSYITIDCKYFDINNNEILNNN